MWELPDQIVVCVLTENADDEGMSITNAAATIITLLDHEYPRHVIEMVEEYPNSAARYSFARTTPGVGVTWEHLDPDRARRTLPGLDRL